MTTTEYGVAFQRGFDVTVRLLISRGAQYDYAREVAQGAWVRGLERLEQLRSDKLVVTWVNAIALNSYRRFIRKESAFQPLPELNSDAGVNLARIDVSRLLRVCRPPDRALLVQQMRGVTAKEIAREQGVTETAARIRLLRARRAARARLEERSRVLAMHHS